jgi:hypothetical protein
MFTRTEQKDIPMSYRHLSAFERFKLYQYRITDHLTMDEIVIKMK